MNKGQSEAEHRLRRAGSSSIAPSPRLVDRLEHGAPESMTPADAWKAACAAKQRIETAIAASRRGCPSCAVRLAPLLERRAAVDAELSRTRAALGMARPRTEGEAKLALLSAFMDEAQERLTAAQWKAIFEAAHQRVRERRASEGGS